MASTPAKPSSTPPRRSSWPRLVDDSEQLGGACQDDLQTGLEWVPLEKVGQLDLLPEVLRPLIQTLAVGLSEPAYLGDTA